MSHRITFTRELKSREIVHYADANRLITSWHNVIYASVNGESRTIRIPGKGNERLLGRVRLARRLLRLDKCNVFPAGDDLVVIRRGKVYHYEWGTDKLNVVLQLRNCNNVLHQSINSDAKGNIYFGEYGPNKERKSVPVYKSADGGRNWSVVYEFEPGKIKHIHGCYWDEIEEKVWICTGDFAGENWIVAADEDFKLLEWIGDGSQKYRTCNFFFEKNSVHWIMDSQLEPSYHYKMDRASRNVERLQMFQGPVWYMKRLTDGYYLAGTTQEHGDGVLDKQAHLMLSEDLERWEDVFQFKHDGFSKKYFKNGIISFADGAQDSKRFFMFFEALKGFDGKCFECRLDGGKN